MKISKKLMRWLGIYFLLDGLLTLFLGRKYVQLYRFGPRRSLYRRMIAWLMKIPVWQLRGAGAAEAGLGLVVLNEAPIDVPTLYRLIASTYAAIDPGWRKWLYPNAHNAFDRVLVDSLPKGGDVLDLGSGAGANLARLQAWDVPYGSYTGVDLTDAMLQQAKKRYGNLLHVKFQQMNLLTDPLPEGPYDLILSTWVFEHLPNPVLVAEKAWQQLKPGGRLALLFEVQGTSFANRMTNWFYPFLSIHRVEAREVRRFPGQVVQEQRFLGPLGDLLLLVLEKPKSGNL